MDVSLVVLQGNPPGAKIPITSRQFLIGREPRCHLRPRSPLVSKWHCAIFVQDDGVYVRDLNSTNGTFVNNHRVQGQVKVHDGDILRVGPLSFAFQIAGAVPERAKTEPSAAQIDAAVLDWVMSAEPTAAMSEEPEPPTALDVSRTIIAETPREPERPTRTRPPRPPAAQPLEEEPTRPAEVRPVRNTAEVANELLEKLLQPRRRGR
jgi:predicted component of type VI protein secretion system